MAKNDAIYLLGGDGTLERVPLESYSAETVLQKLIGEHPELLSGEQMDPEDPPRWLLVKKEAGIPDGDEEAAAGQRTICYWITMQDQPWLK